MPLPCTSTRGGPSPASITRTATGGSARRTRRPSTFTPHAANSRCSACLNPSDRSSCKCSVIGQVPVRGRLIIAHALAAWWQLPLWQRDVHGVPLDKRPPQRGIRDPGTAVLKLRRSGDSKPSRRLLLLRSSSGAEIGGSGSLRHSGGGWTTDSDWGCGRMPPIMSGPTVPWEAKLMRLSERLARGEDLREVGGGRGCVHTA